MKKLATLVPTLAAVVVAAFLVPHQAQASTDARRAADSAGATLGDRQHGPRPTPTATGHPIGAHPTPTATPSPSSSGTPGGHQPNPAGPGGPGWTDPGWTDPRWTDPRWTDPHWTDPGRPGPDGPGGNANGFGGTQPHSWHNSGNQHLPHCGTGQLLVDGSFEKPRLPAGVDYMLFNQATVPGWRTDDPHGDIELWNGALMGVPPVAGRQLAEINATGGSDSLYQDFRTVPGSVLNWSVAIRARNTTPGAPDVDTTQVHFGPSPHQGQGGALGATGMFSYRNSADDSHWKMLYGYYQVPTDQTWTRLSLTSIAHDGPVGYGNLVDKANVTGMRC